MLLQLADLPPPKAKLVTIRRGAAGTRDTLRLMVQLTQAGKHSVNVRLAAQQITQPVAQRDTAGEVRALHRFVRDRIRFVRDVNGTETLQEPERTLQFKAGDCDDKAMLLAAMLESIGYKTRFHAIGFQPGVFSHVYTEVRLGKAWVPLETTQDWPPGRTVDAVSHMIMNVAR